MSTEEEMLKDLATILERYGIRKYTCMNGFGYSQIERDIVGLLKPVGMYNKCTVRKDLIINGEAVPIGSTHYLGTDELPYRWLYEDLFQVYYEGKWQPAESIDFEF